MNYQINNATKFDHGIRLLPVIFFMYK